MQWLDWSTVVDGAAGTLAQADPPAGDPAGAPAQQSPLGIWPLLLGLGVIFYLLLIRPQQKQQREHEKMLKELKKNDSVRTSGGIFGKVVSIESDQDQVVLEVDENRNVRLRVLRSAIVAVLDREKKNDSPAEAPAGKSR